MENIAVIDTETNWLDKVMSIGVVIAEVDTLNPIGYKYYILTPEYLDEGMYSYALRLQLNLNYDTVECSREQAISDLLSWLQENQITKIFAYNASFDYRHLPELQNFTWYDIMRLAAYRQYNNKITDEECCSTGRLRRNFGVECMKKLLTGLEGEQHHALSDAIDELTCIMKPLGYKVEEYIQYVSKKNSAKKKPQLLVKLKVQNIDKYYEVIRPKFYELYDAVYQLQNSPNNYVILERDPNTRSRTYTMTFIKASGYENRNIWVYLQIKNEKTGTLLSFRKKSDQTEFNRFLLAFKKGKLIDTSEFEIFNYDGI